MLKFKWCHDANAMSTNAISEKDALHVTLLTALVMLTSPLMSNVFSCSIVNLIAESLGKLASMELVYIIVRFSYIGAGSTRMVLYCNHIKFNMIKITFLIDFVIH